MFAVTMLVGSALATQVVVDLKDGTPLSEAEEILGFELKWVHPLSADEGLAYLELPSLKERSSESEANTDQVVLEDPLTLELLDELENFAIVETIEPSIPYTAFSSDDFIPPNDPLYDKQWNFELIDAQKAWMHSTGSGITVAVLDTGLAIGKDLNKDQIETGLSFVSNEPTVTDKNGHGTHVAGTIAQATNNKYGTTGLAYGANLLPIKVLDRYGSGRSEWIAAGIDAAVDNGADVINLSLGGSLSKVVQIAVSKAIDAGVVVVAAAGNTGKRGVSSPASIEGVIAVSAIGPDSKLAPYSSYGPEIAIAAPGGNKMSPSGGILQETIVGSKFTFKELQGTSMACPHVSASIALILSALDAQEKS